MLTSSTFQRLRDYLRTNVAALALSGRVTVPTGLTNFGTMAKAIKNGTATSSPLIWCDGDSTTAGYTASSHANSYPGKLIAALNAAGIKAVDAGNFSNQVFVDPRFTFSGSGQSGTVLGGANYFQTYNTGTISFTQTFAVDTFNVYFIGTTGSGSCTVSIDGTQIDTVNQQTPGNEIFKKTYTCTKGAHTLTLTNAGGYSLIACIEAYDSTAHAFRVIGAGTPGASAYNFSSPGGFGEQGLVAAVAPFLTIYTIGGADWDAGHSVSDYVSWVQPYITNAQASGDIYLVGPGATNDVSEAAQDPFLSALSSLAASNNEFYLSLRAAIPQMADFATAQANGLMSDNEHPNDSGYALQAAAIAAPLISAAAAS